MGVLGLVHGLTHAGCEKWLKSSQLNLVTYKDALRLCESPGNGLRCSHFFFVNINLLLKRM